MPSRGHRDESKRLERSIADKERRPAKLYAQLGDDDKSEYYKKKLADARAQKALTKAAWGRERHLPYLVKIGELQNRDGLSAHAAARIIADEMGGNARVRHANHKTLYRKFEQAPALYRRLALASEDPSDAAEREIAESLGVPARADYERQREALHKKYTGLYWAEVMPQLLERAHRALEEDELAWVLYNTRDFKSMDEFAIAYSAVCSTLESNRKDALKREK